MFTERAVSAKSGDGLVLPGTWCSPKGRAVKDIAVLVHGGGGVDRSEDGFYDRCAHTLAAEGIASVRFDHRAFLANRDRRLLVTIAGMCNDIIAVCRWATKGRRRARVHVVAASFGGGAAALAATLPTLRFRSLVLFNPLVDYRARLLEEKPFWKDSRLTDAGVRELARRGYLRHGSTLRMTPPLINEVAVWDAEAVGRQVRVPTLVVHGTSDRRIQYRHSLAFGRQVSKGTVRLIKGADHGFTVAGDDEYTNPKTVKWQDLAFSWAADWIHRH